MLDAFVGAVFLGAVSTLGDFVWAAFHIRHRTSYGIVHGAIICLCVGAVIGWRARRLVPGIVAGPLIGVAAAGLFYVLARFLRYSAMYPAWMFFWCCFALLQEQLKISRDYRFAAIRGLASAVASAAAFYALRIWNEPSVEPPNYLRIFINWSFAFLPGFVALFIGTTGPGNESSRVRT